MRHLFSTGEILHEKNKKKLSEGIFQGQFIEYEDLEPDTRYFCIGTIDGRGVKIRFKVSESSFQDIKSRHSLGILMQSDILEAEWERYEIFDGE